MADPCAGRRRVHRAQGDGNRPAAEHTRLGILGLNGTTAYFGLRESCAAKAGDTVVVSSAAGAVGSAVGQIAHIMGCRTVGIAGGAEKARQCLEEFGFDAAIDYKGRMWRQAIATHCPEGVDCYFDNTCGPISDAVMGHLAQGRADHDLRDSGGDGVGPGAHGTARAPATSGRACADAGLPDLRLQDRLQEARDALAGWLREGTDDRARTHP
jgi:NADPH:quinone reductase-like Zn-dependent oxidoreductase